MDLSLVAIVRLSLFGRLDVTQAEIAEDRDYLQAVVANEQFIDALRDISPSLHEQTLKAIELHRDASASRLARLAEALEMYRLRAAHRPTPLGLLSVVSLAQATKTAPNLRDQLDQTRELVRQVKSVDLLALSEALLHQLPEILYDTDQLVMNQLSVIRGMRLEVSFMGSSQMRV